MNSNPNCEAVDVDRVNAALKALSADNLDIAESILLKVVENTPSDYLNFEEDNNAISIKFWDQTSFIHYVTWHKNQGTANKSIRWIGNAYSRAYYYLGFICVKREKFDQAIEFLDKGEALEPTNPMFSIEKAFALVHSRHYQEALVVYDQVAEIGPFVNAHDIAVAQRGRGSALIEMGNLDNAEVAFKLSLQFEPGNKVALNELLYIERLRQGSRATYSETVTSTCSICGKRYHEGVIVSLSGRQTVICENCASEHLK